MHPLVSIIIPNYNRAELIGETLNSIIAQTYTNWECIIVDDGSTDDSAKVITGYSQKDQRIKLYNRPKTKPKGANACRNYGLELSKGAYINWFDSDDLMHPDKLKLQLQGLQSTSKLYSVCQSLVFKETIDNIIGLKSPTITSKNPFEDYLTKQIIWLTAAPIFSRKFLVENNYSFDERLMAGQEWELFTRIMYQYRDYYAIEQPPLVYLREHEKRISQSESGFLYYNYYLARLKIYRSFKSGISQSSIRYLQNYFLMIYKLLLRQKAYSFAFKVWKMSLIRDSSYTLRQHCLLVIAFVSYALTGKGDVFLTKVHRWDLLEEVI